MTPQQRADAIRDRKAVELEASLEGLGSRTGPDAPCGHGINDEGETCGVTPTRLYPGGVRCVDHTPAAISGRTIPMPPDPPVARPRARSPHEYGPHDPAAAPETVEVLVGRRGAVQRAEVPVPGPILKQRAGANGIAYEAARLDR